MSDPAVAVASCEDVSQRGARVRAGLQRWTEYVEVICARTKRYVRVYLASSVGGSACCMMLCVPTFVPTYFSRSCCLPTKKHALRLEQYVPLRWDRFARHPAPCRNMPRQRIVCHADLSGL